MKKLDEARKISEAAIDLYRKEKRCEELRVEYGHKIAYQKLISIEFQREIQIAGSAMVQSKKKLNKLIERVEDNNGD